MAKDARRSRRLPSEHQLHLAEWFRSVDIPALAEGILSPRFRRPEWQRRITRWIRRIVSPAYRARCRRAGEFARLVTMASRASEREQAGPQVAQLTDTGNPPQKGTHDASTPEGSAETVTPDKGVQDLHTPELGTQIVSTNEGFAETETPEVGTQIVSTSEGDQR